MTSTLPAGCIKRIHVNQYVIRANQKKRKAMAPLTVKTYNRSQKAHEVRIDGPSVLVYRPTAPLSCGARVWIETTAEVTLL